VPVSCVGQPQVSIGLTQDEAESIKQSAKKKIVIFAKTLRARIDAQCKINTEHDRLHGEK
jgi:hypothetical protein